jgi:hypothetical protein
MKNAWKAVPVMGATLAAAAVAALGLLYWSNVQDREHYLQSRNFRLLDVLARQSEQLFENRRRVYVTEITPWLTAIKPRAQWVPWPAAPRSSEERGPSQGALHEVEGGDVWLTGRKIDSEKLKGQLRNYESRTLSDRQDLQFEWFPGAGTDSKETVLKIKVPADRLLDTIFLPKLSQRAFDTLLLADVKGTVVYAAGRRATEMHATSVAALLPKGTETTGDKISIADRVSEERVLIAGVQYRMFKQPCCRSAETDGFVVVGLLESQTMLEASLAISPVLVLAGVVLVIALLVCWSFLKVALIGPQQRVTRVDVLQLGASGIFGLALIIILLLTTSAYARLSADVDEQLELLADRLHQSLSREFDAAASQLQKMVDTLSAHDCIKIFDDGARPPDFCKNTLSAWSDGTELPDAYSNFNAFALADRYGFQHHKAASDPTARQPVNVADRAYFNQVRSREGLWKLEICRNDCILESHWSWTTGKPQVVLATPTGSKDLPVAALSIPMKPLLEPVLPPGFEFAVIDQDGLVHFHSDKQRNVHENLLLETDHDPRLRSLMTAHAAGTLNTPYWGRPYRAYVRPTLIPGWSIVALHAKQPARALVLEWSAVALLMQSIYMLVWIALTVVLMSSKASWLWPDPLRRPWYRVLLIVYIAALLAWLAVAARADTMTILWTGLCLPPALWGITCLVLLTRPQDVGQPKAWSDLWRDYRLAGALMLAITAGVPAASIFARSSNLHLGAYLKEQQIALARNVGRFAKCSHTACPPFGPEQWARYDDVFYRSNVTCELPASGGLAGSNHRTVHAKYEDYLPYFTSASITLRELMHQRSDDDAWASLEASPDRQAVGVGVQDPNYRLGVSSPRLPIFDVLSLGNVRHLVWTAAAALLLLAGAAAFGAYAIVGYLLRRVVLADIVEPVCTNGHVVTSPGQHVLVICENPGVLANELKDVHSCPLMPIVTATNVANAWRQAKREVSRLAPTQRIVIPDLDERSEDVALMRRKLELVDDLMTEPEQTVLLLTTMSKRALAASMRDSWKWSQEPERWSKVVARLTVVDTRPAGSAATKGSEVTPRPTWWGEVKALLRERLEHLRSWKTGARAHGDWRKSLLDAEARACPAVEPFCRDLESTKAFQDGRLSKDQILEELEERAASIYRNLWQSRDEEERIVLEHVAQHGLASAASRRVVRRLLARGLLRKDPDLRLMNHSFRRFVLEIERRREVVALERQAGPSVWDRLRFPLGMAGVIAVVFLAVTQREAFDATLTMAAGVTAAVPTLAKLMSVLAQFTARGPGEPKPHA